MPWAATGAVDGRISIWDVSTLRLRQTIAHDVCQFLHLHILVSNIFHVSFV